MSLLKIQVLGSSILRVETTPVAEITDELQLLIDDMFETMHAAQGIGLAAPQVGRSERLAVIEIEGEQYVIINPEIVEESGSAKDEEGCLSIPEIYGEVERSTQVVVHAMDRHGKHFEIAADGLLARCLQHEIDHLHGKLFIDYLSFLKRRAAIAKWELQKSKYPDLVRELTPDVVKRLREDHEHDDERL
ncbi:MAG: peptide deformylase [Gemmatimonadetes bacterium]|nr:peptide deformylase [Gemmatimonadota bacterium]MBP9105796.1 peptide deformylase [Gemmatimonadaceae bacterium]MBK6843522.1 peptide deformylase [Gemmatimonadota bacterium]MBK7833385.1 peptide deformylase [Gemmatimonadota bacterium]MBK8061099.1 peptide deformylase [Gemmatimonadota bacterium]